CNSGVCRVTPGPDVPSMAWFQPCEVLQYHPAFRNLKEFQYGEVPDPEQDRYHSGTQFRHLAGLLSRMTRLEELYLFGHCRDFEDEPRRIFGLANLGNLRVFQHYHGLDYPLEVLAANPSLSRLTHLLCYPHSFAMGRDGSQSQGTMTRERLQAVVRSPHP